MTPLEMYEMARRRARWARGVYSLKWDEMEELWHWLWVEAIESHVLEKRGAREYFLWWSRLKTLSWLRWRRRVGPSHYKTEGVKTLEKMGANVERQLEAHLMVEKLPPRLRKDLLLWQEGQRWTTPSSRVKVRQALARAKEILTHNGTI
jgi:hypothetical protein